MTIGIIAAMEYECDLLLDSLEKIEEIHTIGYTFNLGKIGNNEVVICKSGVGKVNAAMATTLLINEFSCEFIINTGIAGGINNVETNDIVVATELAWNDFDIRIFGYPYGQVPEMPARFMINPEVLTYVKSVLNKLNLKYKEGLVISSDSFITSKEVIHYDDALACEMEGCAVSQVALKAGVDFLVLRYISDIVGKENQEKDYKEFERIMSERSAKIT